MYKGRIENWKELDLLGSKYIVGDIYDSSDTKRLPNGEGMFTPTVVKYHQDGLATMVETRSGSMYLLGKPATDTRAELEVLADMSKVTMH